MNNSIKESDLTGKTDETVREPNRHTAKDLTPHLLGNAGMEFVPVEKFTLAVAFGVLKDRICHGCDADCTQCVITTLLNKLEDAVGLPAILDADMRVIAYDTDASGNLIRKLVGASDAEGR